jgi:hypothetical protein
MHWRLSFDKLPRNAAETGYEWVEHSPRMIVVRAGLR